MMRTLVKHSRNYPKANTDDNASSALRLMKDHGVDAILVVEKEMHDKLVGTITTDDILWKTIQGGKSSLSKLKMKDIMSRIEVTACQEDDYTKVFRKMVLHHAKIIPVVSEGEVLGMITFKDLASRAGEIHDKNHKFMIYQNAQTIVILLLLIFLFLFFLFKTFL